MLVSNIQCQIRARKGQRHHGGKNGGSYYMSALDREANYSIIFGICQLS
jgi:hypothetical protein